MPSGGPGDHPVPDIVHWRRPVYSLEVDTLIAELSELLDAPRLEEFLDGQRITWMDPAVDELARAQTALAAERDRLYRSAQARGWDMESMDRRMSAQREAVAAAWAEPSER